MPDNKRNKYDNESISSLKGADRVRKKPSVIFGSDGVEGCQHAFFEILSNAIDEAKGGFGNLITIKYHADKTIEVSDRGRGCPVDYNNSEKCYNWELVFCELYAGGKYNNDIGGTYDYSLGLNGLGACATQYASEFMDVTVWRDGFEYSLHFEKGVNIGGLQKKEYNKKNTGTKIVFKPDTDVFISTDIPIEYFLHTIKKQSIVNQGTTFEFSYLEDGIWKVEKFYYANGILDYVNEIALDAIFQPVLWSAERRGKDREDLSEYNVKMNFALTFTKNTSFTEYYHNSSFLEYGGSPDKAVKTAFVWAIDNYIKQNSKYNKGESKITYQDISDCMVLVSNSFSTQTSYENQTKKAISNKFIQESMTEFLKHELEVFLIENKIDAEKISGQVLINKRSRENAEKVRAATKKKLSGNIDIQNRVQKFVDCRTKDVTRRELFIVEGDSALGSVKLARDSDFQGIMPLRGKILNCLKSDYSKIFKSDVITDLIKVLGCGVEMKSKHTKSVDFNIDSLRWSKVIICTDADVDGFQIRTLVLTMIYRLMPSLIEQGKVFIAESPLYEIETKKNTYFAYNEKEKQAILSKISGKYDISRSKGLGENDPEMMWKSTLNPETRRLIEVMPEEAETTSEMFDLLLGDNLQGRKDYIADNGHLYLDELDVS